MDSKPPRHVDQILFDLRLYLEEYSAWLEGRFERPREDALVVGAGVERQLALRMIKLLHLLDELAACPLPIAIERHRNGLKRVLHDQIGRWHWGFLLGPDPVSKIERLMRRHHKKLGVPFLRHNRT